MSRPCVRLVEKLTVHTPTRAGAHRNASSVLEKYVVCPERTKQLLMLNIMKRREGEKLMTLQADMPHSACILVSLQLLL